MKKLFWWILSIFWSIPEVIYRHCSKKEIRDENLTKVAKYLFKKVGW